VGDDEDEEEEEEAFVLEGESTRGGRGARVAVEDEEEDEDAGRGETVDIGLVDRLAPVVELDDKGMTCDRLDLPTVVLLMVTLRVVERKEKIKICVSLFFCS
jgi:hypothetical protein